MIEMMFEYFELNGDEEFLTRRLKNLISTRLPLNQ